MNMRFSSKRCTVDELLNQQALISEITAGQDLPALHFVAQQYRELETQNAARCALLMDGAEAVGFLIARRAGLDQANTAVLDVSAARLELREQWQFVLGEIILSEFKSMALEMGASGFRIPVLTSGPASAATTGRLATGTGTAFYEAFR